MSAPSPWHQLRDSLQTPGGPIVVYNKSHSGSRLLARLVEESGVFMGAHQNDSRDSLDILEMVNYLVLNYYPDYSRLWHDPASTDKGLFDVIRTAFEHHLEGYQRGSGDRWGWKLCETLYIAPVISFLFPSAKVIHIIRDGRDVAFCDHHAPSDPFWRKIYFNTDRITGWGRLKLTTKDYRRRSHVYNTLHWINSVTAGRHYGMMLHQRYLEVRYEALCTVFPETAGTVLKFVGAEEISPIIDRLKPDVHTSSVHKYLKEPRRKVREVVKLATPLLLSLGYLKADGRR